jgi:hypothetical protein
VTREQFITGIIRNREKDVEKQRVALQKLEQERQEQLAGREARIRDLRKVLDQTEKDPAKREKLMQDALKMAAVMEAGTAKAVEDGPRQLAELERLLLSRLREEYQRLSPSERASPAWYLQSPDGFSGLAPAGAPNAREMVTLNPNYFDMSHPRSDIQLISVTLNSQNETRTGPNFVPSAVRLDEFQATADWARIASFVEPAR